MILFFQRPEYINTYRIAFFLRDYPVCPLVTQRMTGNPIRLMFCVDSYFFFFEKLLLDLFSFFRLLLNVFNRAPGWKVRAFSREQTWWLSSDRVSNRVKSSKINKSQDSIVCSFSIKKWSWNNIGVLLTLFRYSLQGTRTVTIASVQRFDQQAKEILQTSVTLSRSLSGR